jgi:hypothetical protein
VQKKVLNCNIKNDKQTKVINKAIMGSPKATISSSDVIATTCFGLTTIIRWQTVV